MNEIDDVLKHFVHEDNILFATSNLRSGNSADLDIYAVVKEPVKSQVAMFYGTNGLWHEVFIDTEADLAIKLDNFDEIAINFLVELTFACGDKGLFESWRQKAAEQGKNFAQYPLRRMLILEYRVKVIYSKYSDPSNDDLTKKFLLNSLNYHIVSLLLLKHQILPSSPKRWIGQLKTMLEDVEKDLLKELITQNIDPTDLENWVKELTADLKEMRLDKSKADNSLTFIS